ncbi:MAG: magnesium transporter [Gemmatimonadota bacterium]|nr:magnesium transporter [Gemmatimonadota bacterium]
MTPAETVQAHGELAAYLARRHPGEVARMLEQRQPAHVARFLEEQTAPTAVAVLERLSPERATGTIVHLSDERTRAVLSSMDPHRVSALLARLDRETRERNLTVLESTLADELRALSEYPPGTAGSLMDPRVTAFRAEATVKDVIVHLRALRAQRIQDVFLVDDGGRLVGSVPIHEVVLAAPADPLGTLAVAHTPHAQVTWSREAVMDELEAQNVGSLPVVDFEGRLLGVLRQDELLTAARQAGAARMIAMVGASAEERALSSPLFVVRKRLPWLQVNLLTAFLAASVVALFESTIAQFTTLAVLLPVVAGQSGNTGAQALAVTMRGLALREIRIRQWPRVAGKELIAGATNGAAVALTTSLGVFIWSRSAGLALVIAISMVLSMMAAGVSGAMVPIVLSALRQDPAQSSSIVLTTITDVTGFLSFLGIATLLSGIL